MRFILRNAKHFIDTLLMFIKPRKNCRHFCPFCKYKEECLIDYHSNNM